MKYCFLKVREIYSILNFITMNNNIKRTSRLLAKPSTRWRFVCSIYTRSTQRLLWENYSNKNSWRYLKNPSSNRDPQPSESTMENSIFSRTSPLKLGLTSPTSLRLHLSSSLSVNHPFFVPKDLVVSAIVKNFPLYMTCHVILTSSSSAVIVALLTSALIWNL